MENLPPSSAEMRSNLAHDVQMNRYTREILLEIMRLIARQREKEVDDAPVYATKQPASEEQFLNQIPSLSHT